METQPAMVLNDECLISRDLSKSLMGRVKEFASLANLKMTLNNEDEFDDEEDQDDNNVNDDEVKEQNPYSFRDDSVDERIPDTLFQEEVQGVNNMEERVIEQDAEQSDDPFNIYPMLNKLEKTDRKENIYSISSGQFKVSEIPRNGGSILGLLDEVVKVGQVIGYKMEGCVSNIAEIIEAQGAEEVYR
nr:nucleotide-binding alpha-beta plait domain-containing protein [Tanacetum cinerariifolium]